MMPFIVSVDILDDMVFGEFNFRKAQFASCIKQILFRFAY